MHAGSTRKGETRAHVLRKLTCCIRRMAERQVIDPATFSALLIAMPVDLLPLTVDERVQVAAHAPRECA